jgi:pimeloyl-ACP methyl ester carboxylesterase
MAQNEQKVSFGQRWNEAQPTKTFLFWSVVVGIILTIVIGFSWGGWVTAGTAQRMNEVAAKEAVIERMTSICVARFNQDPERDQKLIEMKETGTYDRDNYVRDQGWATMFDDDKPNSKVSDACAKQLVQITP